MADNESFWAKAERPTPLIMRRRRQAAALAAQPPAEPSAAEVEPVDYTMDLEQYAAQRNVPEVNDFGAVKENTSGFPDAADLKGSATAMAAMVNPYRRHERPGETPRQRGIPANLVESQAGITGRGTIRNT
jgi:hypothetical protein